MKIKPFLPIIVFLCTIAQGWSSDNSPLNALKEVINTQIKVTAELKKPINGTFHRDITPSSDLINASNELMGIDAKLQSITTDDMLKEYIEKARTRTSVLLDEMINLAKEMAGKKRTEKDKLAIRTVMLELSKLPNEYNTMAHNEGTPQNLLNESTFLWEAFEKFHSAKKLY